MDEKSSLKPIVRGILLSLGRSATEYEFRKEYFNLEDEPFEEILRKFNMSFFDLMKSLSDVCRVKRIGGQLMIERISSEDSSHLDHLTILKNKGSRQAFR